MANNQPGLVGMAQDGTPNQPTIVAVMVTQANGNTFKANLPVNGTIKKVGIDRDSDLDNGVIAHEYTHRISNRLTGGPANVDCLDNAEEGGEGWSDFVALVLTAKPGQTGTTSRPIGEYVNFTGGIRPTPYTTDLSVNPSHYDSIKTNGEVHFTGYVWASMLWEVYWNLVNNHGFNPNLYDPATSGGNNLALQLVIDGMKLQPCSPGFVDARNAILLADMDRTNGANQCAIWQGFAKRGLGALANQGSSNSTTDGTEDFTVPAGVCPGALSPVHAWIGLKNSDDQGTQFDLRAELLKNGTPVASGLTRCITGVTRNPSLAKEAIVNWDSFPAGTFSSGDVMGLRLSTRIGSTGAAPSARAREAVTTTRSGCGSTTTRPAARPVSTRAGRTSTCLRRQSVQQRGEHRRHDAVLRHHRAGRICREVQGLGCDQLRRRKRLEGDRHLDEDGAVTAG